MFTRSDEDVEALAKSVGVLKAAALRYETPIYSCSQCGTPCSGVMCLSCATK